MKVVRVARSAVERNLRQFPVVALLGPRQVGKTTLALEVAAGLDRESVHLDLERDSDLHRLSEPELYLGRQAGKLVILDEVQRRPELFPLLRGLVDERIRAGERAGHFLVLGSASPDLLRQSSETLAGRIAYLELAPFALLELLDGGIEAGPDAGIDARHDARHDAGDDAGHDPGDDPGDDAGHDAGHDVDPERLWLRGGFPLSYLADTDEQSWDWRTQFLATYLERDVPQLGPRLPAERMRRLWTMLAHGQGAQLNAARLASSMGVSGNTVRNYLDVLCDLYMVRQLPPWSGNSQKRLVKSPKLYVRDSGLVHRLAGVPDLDTLLGHPLCGPSWEGFVIENVLARLPDTWRASYYRTSARAEIDLVLERPGADTIAIEVKRTLSPRVDKGFRLGCDDVGAGRRCYVIPAGERYPIGHDTEAVGLVELLRCLSVLG